MAKMKILCYCMVAVVMIALSKAAIDVERTVKQVQIILQANSQLPRLSRDEIIKLLNDIKAEDAKSKSSAELSKEKKEDKPSVNYNINDNEVTSAKQSGIDDNIVADQNNIAISAPASTKAPIDTITKSEPSVMVVLPYTPRDAPTLQELYTRPPRTEVVPESKVTPKPFKLTPIEKIQQTLKNNAQVDKRKQKVDFPAELQAFLDLRGLTSKPGQDPFLLPLEGFKPLPPARVIDESVQLPENILLAYDLISPSTETQQASDIEAINSLLPTNFQNEPLLSESPFELDTSSSHMEKSVIPLDLPKPRNTKSASKSKPNYDPIDYDSVRVIPLHTGPNPLEDEKITLENDLGKRQAINFTVQSQISAASAPADEVTTTTPASDAKDAITNAPSASDSDTSADTDTGASIADLEDSFGGAVPAQPGDSDLPPPKKNGFYWMLDWNSFLEVGDGDTKVNIRFEPKLGDPQMFLPVNVP